MKTKFVSLKPISVNRCWQGRRFKTKEYDSWIELGLYLLPKVKMHKGEISIRLSFFVKNAKRSDLDNMIKPTLDLLVKGGWIEDDRFIYNLVATKNQSEEEGIEIEIY